MAKYEHRSEKIHILKKLRMSRKLKIKNGWSREVGAGFIKADIENIELDGNDLKFTFGWGTQTIPIQELNLRETEEAIKFLEDRRRR